MFNHSGDNQNDIYRSKYYKYKNKYLNLKNSIGGSSSNTAATVAAQDSRPKYIPPYLRTKEQKEEAAAAAAASKIDNKSPLVRKEIPGEITEYKKNEIYEFKGIISCVGLIVTGQNESDKYGLGIHIINSESDGHFVNGEFTAKGEVMKANILEKINSWPSNTNLDIKFYKVPLLDSIRFHSDTIGIINQLKTLFNQNYQARINKCEEIISNSCVDVEF